jgi:hypothetical protein
VIENFRNAYAESDPYCLTYNSVIRIIKPLIFEFFSFISSPVLKVTWNQMRKLFGFDAKGLDQKIVAENPPISLRSGNLTQNNIIDSWCIRLVDTYFNRDSEVNLVVQRLRAFVGE